MTAGKLNLEIEQGATFSHTLIWKDSGGTPIDITGYTAKMQIRPAAGDESLHLELSDTNGRIIITGAEGKVELLVASVDTTSLSWDGNAYYDLELTAPDSTVTRLVEGEIRLSREITT